MYFTRCETGHKHVSKRQGKCNNLDSLTVRERGGTLHKQGLPPKRDPLHSWSESTNGPVQQMVQFFCPSLLDCTRVYTDYTSGSKNKNGMQALREKYKKNRIREKNNYINRKRSHGVANTTFQKNLISRIFKTVKKMEVHIFCIGRM